MQGIFISYRRQDSQSAAGRLTDHLRDNMPAVPIFRDIETIEPGVDFVDAINRALQSCGILLAVIGPRWGSLTDSAGRRRLDDPNDYTRLEIATALQRSDVRVIPVLVEGAEMPGSDTLPDDLKALARRNAIELTDRRWEFDVSKLVETLNKALNITPAPPPRPDPTPPQPPAPVPATAGGWKKWAWGFGILFVIGAVYNAEEGGNDAVMPVVSQPVQHSGTVSQAAGLPASPVGGWQDADGGKYLIQQQGNQLGLQGVSIHGQVIGSGMLQGNQLSISYTVNGAPYQAVLLLSQDGLNLQGQYRSPVSGENGLVHLVRMQ